MMGLFCFWIAPAPLSAQRASRRVCVSTAVVIAATVLILFLCLHGPIGHIYASQFAGSSHKPSQGLTAETPAPKEGKSGASSSLPLFRLFLNVTLLKLAEAARMLAISRALVHRWVSEGRIPAIVLGVGPKGHRIIRIRAESIERFIADQEKESAAPSIRMKSNRKWEAS